MPIKDATIVRMPAEIKIKETLIYSAAIPANIPLIGKAKKLTYELN